MNKLNPDLWIIGVPALIIIVGAYLLFKPTEYKDQPIPNSEDYSHLAGITPEEIQDTLVSEQEKFVGTIDYKYTNFEKTVVDIHMFNDYTGDDSVTATDEIYTATKEDQLWKIISVKKRWKCRGLFFGWTTSVCS